MGINSMESLLPNVKQVAVFDTSFHQTMPDKAYLFAVPYEYYDKYKFADTVSTEQAISL